MSVKQIIIVFKSLILWSALTLQLLNFHINSMSRTPTFIQVLFWEFLSWFSFLIMEIKYDPFFGA